MATYFPETSRQEAYLFPHGGRLKCREEGWKLRRVMNRKLDTLGYLKRRDARQLHYSRISNLLKTRQDDVSIECCL